jgi:hypothetical protein
VAEESAEVYGEDKGVNIHSHTDRVIIRDPQEKDPGGNGPKTTTPVSSGRHKWAVFAIVGLFLVGAAGIAVYLNQPPPKPPVLVEAPSRDTSPPPPPPPPKILIAVDCSVVQQSLAHKSALTQQFEARWTAVRAMDFYQAVGAGDGIDIALLELSKATCYGPIAVTELIRIIDTDGDTKDPNRTRIIEELRASK